MGPIVSRLSLPAAVMITMIKAIPNMDTKGITLSSHLALPLSSLLKRIPAPMGMITILKISHIIFRALILTKAPASHFIKKGVTKGASMVDTAVMVMDNAKLALAG